MYLIFPVTARNRVTSKTTGDAQKEEENAGMDVLPTKLPDAKKDEEGDPGLVP